MSGARKREKKLITSYASSYNHDDYHVGDHGEGTRKRRIKFDNKMI